MRGVMPSAAHFALLTLPETGRATGRCSQCESTTAEQATEYFSGGGAAQKARPAPGSRWSACETDRCKGNRYLGNNSVSWPKSPIQERVVLVLMDDRRVPIDPRVSHGFAPLRVPVASNLLPAAQTVPGAVFRG